MLVATRRSVNLFKVLEQKNEIIKIVNNKNNNKNNFFK
jgi:hypothetical protein